MEFLRKQLALSELTNVAMIKIALIPWVWRVSYRVSVKGILEKRITKTHASNIHEDTSRHIKMKVGLAQTINDMPRLNRRNLRLSAGFRLILVNIILHVTLMQRTHYIKKLF